VPKVTGLSHIVLHCNDLDTMVEFYQRVLGLVKVNEYVGRMVFLTADPKKEDHMLALTRGREGDAKILAHIAWHVPTPTDVKAAYEEFKASGIPIDHTVSHAYMTGGNTVSCYFLDPEGNRLEVFAMVEEEAPEQRGNRPIDLEESLDEIVAKASGRTPVASH
jgi:catechol-2,3-dioxygenase